MTQEERNRKVDWLNRARGAERLANAYVEILERDRETAQKLTRVISDMPRSNKNENSTENALIRFTETSMLVQQALGDLLKVRDEITRAIKKIDDTDLQAILTLRYLCYMTVEQTAETMCYDRATIGRKLNSALEILEIPEIAPECT